MTLEEMTNECEELRQQVADLRQEKELLMMHFHQAVTIRQYEANTQDVERLSKGDSKDD